MNERTQDILLVEDDGNDVAVALRAFRRNQLIDQVVVLRDGEEALVYLRSAARERRLPKVILLDLKMPRLSGWDVLRAVRSDAILRRIPMVVVSSSDRELDVREAYRLGASSYVVKKFDPARPGEYLVDAARYWLDLNRPAHQSMEG